MVRSTQDSMTTKKEKRTKKQKKYPKNSINLFGFLQ